MEKSGVRFPHRLLFGQLVQRKNFCMTRRRSLVQLQYCPLISEGSLSVQALALGARSGAFDSPPSDFDWSRTVNRGNDSVNHVKT